MKVSQFSKKKIYLDENRFYSKKKKQTRVRRVFKERKILNQDESIFSKNVLRD